MIAIAPRQREQPKPTGARKLVPAVLASQRIPAPAKTAISGMMSTRKRERTSMPVTPNDSSSRYSSTASVRAGIVCRADSAKAAAPDSQRDCHRDHRLFGHENIECRPTERSKLPCSSPQTKRASTSALERMKIERDPGDRSGDCREEPGAHDLTGVKRPRDQPQDDERRHHTVGEEGRRAGGRDGEHTSPPESSRSSLPRQRRRRQWRKRSPGTRQKPQPAGPIWLWSVVRWTRIPRLRSRSPTRCTEATVEVRAPPRVPRS